MNGDDHPRYAEPDPVVEIGSPTVRPAALSDVVGDRVPWCNILSMSAHDGLKRL